MQAKSSVEQTVDHEHTGDPHVSGEATSRQLVIGQTVGRYQVRRLLGEGGMGQVYLARDVTLGRSVALKLVRFLSVGVEETARILHEARAIAALNHPHIVQLYDVGEHGGGLYLALEYVDGEPLRERAQRGPLSVDEVLRHGRAIADALAHAHGLGIFHCDLKPANVMIGRDGRLRVVDFGIAQTADVSDHQTAGTPEWMAPEQDRGAPSDRSDIWALALMIVRLLAHGGEARAIGSRVDREQAMAAGATSAAWMASWHRELAGVGVPAAVLDLLRRSLVVEPSERPSAQDWLHALTDALAGRAAADGEDGPYRGLFAFHEEHARTFFGREADLDELVEHLRDEPCLPIVGPSGVGKSSLLRAGLVPRLTAREPTTVLSLRPGEHPVAALARAVVVAMHEGEAGAQVQREAVELEQQLLEAPTLLAARLATLAAATGRRVLLAIDQLEEAFTHGATEVVRERFVQMVLAAADDPHDPVRVVFTLRDDFLGRIARVRALVVVRRMSQDELRRTIVAPLAQVGYRFDDPHVVDEMLAEAAGGSAVLPLVQFACRALWDGRDRTAKLLRRDTYAAMGGISGALGRHAEAALAELADDERRVARQLLLQLVSERARVSVPRSQLDALGPLVGRVCDHLLRARLLAQHVSVDAGEPIIEIAHESLLTRWPQLARWIDESREELRLLAELEDAAALRLRRGRQAIESWTAEELAATRGRIARLALVVPKHVQALLDEVAAHHAQRRRRALARVAAATALTSIAAVVAFLWIGRFQLRERKARGNFGKVELVLRPFEYGERAQVRWIDVAELPALRFSLHAIDGSDEHRPGAPLPDEVVRIDGHAVSDGKLRARVEAPGGMAFLRIDGRGRAGQECGPAWVRLRALPGYSTSAQGEVPRLEVAVASCQASGWDMIDIEAGPFLYGGPGEPPAALYGANEDYTQPLETIDLPRFAIDRTEVSNAAYAPFAAMETVTGYRAPRYPTDSIHAADGEPERPVAAVDAFGAEAFCRFLGKQLPSDEQWVKAARGGLTVRGAPNPHPARLFPWGTEPARECANVAGVEDGHRWVAPVDAYLCGASPYGVLQLAGNVEEWSLSSSRTRRTTWRELRGGAAASPYELEHHTTSFQDHREETFHDYGVGVRCAWSFAQWQTNDHIAK